MICNLYVVVDPAISISLTYIYTYLVIWLKSVYWLPNHFLLYSTYVYIYKNQLNWQTLTQNFVYGFGLSIILCTKMFIDETKNKMHCALICGKFTLMKMEFHVTQTKKTDTNNNTANWEKVLSAYNMGTYTSLSLYLVFFFFKYLMLSIFEVDFLQTKNNILFTRKLFYDFKTNNLSREH